MIKVYQSLFCISFLFICYSAFTPSEGNSSILFLDKILHFGAFFLLSFLLDRSTRRPLIYHKGLIIFLVIFAVSIEIIQSFLPRNYPIVSMQTFLPRKFPIVSMQTFFPGKFTIDTRQP